MTTLLLIVNKTTQWNKQLQHAGFVLHWWNTGIRQPQSQDSIWISEYLQQMFSMKSRDASDRGSLALRNNTVCVPWMGWMWHSTHSCLRISVGQVSRVRPPVQRERERQIWNVWPARKSLPFYLGVGWEHCFLWVLVLKCLSQCESNCDSERQWRLVRPKRTTCVRF